MIDYHYLEGGLTGTPEIRYTPNGRGVTTFTIAQSDSKKNDTGEWETTANTYLRVNIWDTDRHTWTDLLTNLTKGTKVVVRGKLVTNKWQDKDGNNRSQVEVQAFHVYVDAASGTTPPPSNNHGNTNTWPTNNTGGFNQTPKDENPPF